MSSQSARGSVRLVISSIPQSQAVDIARQLVEQKLAACVSVVPAVQSLYFWDDRICEDTESLLLIKTTADLTETLKRDLTKLHPYEVPEILCLDVDDAGSSAAYLRWIIQSVGD